MYNVTEYGVFGDGKKNNTRFINELTEKVSNLGGGTIYFPPGQYITGSISLKSNMTLYLDAGAEILGSENPEDYPMIDNISGLNPMRQGLISAINASDVTIKGEGVIDGRGYNWWGHYKNENDRPRAVSIILCQNVKIKDVYVKNSAVWTIHPICCQNVVIDSISIKNPADSPNTDGINPESCQNVKISNCSIDVGDDCLTLKSGTELTHLQKSSPCENITVTNCVMLNGHGGVVIGSEMSGGVRNVVISNCIFNGTDRGIRIKTRRRRAGIVEDVSFNNIIMKNVMVPIAINGYYRCGADRNDKELFSLGKCVADETTPIIRNISINQLTAKNAALSAIYILGIPEMPISGLSISNSTIEMANDGTIVDEPIMSAHRITTCGEGAHLENVRDSLLENVKISCLDGEELVLQNCENIKINQKVVSTSQNI